MSEPRQKWKPSKRDAVFLLLVGTVVLALSLGSHERRTAATPNDKVHTHATSRSACMTCHGKGGIRPQPAGHTRADQCFQCHQQPAGWAGDRP